MESKTSPKKIPTNEEGIFYKSIINENGKEIDKTYIIRDRENNIDKLKLDFKKVTEPSTITTIDGKGNVTLEFNLKKINYKNIIIFSNNYFLYLQSFEIKSKQ